MIFEPDNIPIYISELTFLKSFYSDVTDCIPDVSFCVPYLEPCYQAFYAIKEIPIKDGPFPARIYLLKRNNDVSTMEANEKVEDNHI